MKLNTLDGQNTALESKPVDSAPLKHSVERAMDIYFTNLDGQDVTNVYQMVLNEECLMKHIAHHSIVDVD